ncbi:helix-turn-helix transcriptional regulator [Streptomyces sp. NPDC098077]|uniref:helix-turn-helix transcriptional regulator n=1 Tax=Streptomyces sp. NPDC098077 TaxID=3366093 RepID=UPI0038174790
MIPYGGGVINSSMTEIVRKSLKILLVECRLRLSRNGDLCMGNTRSGGISQERVASLLNCSTRWYATFESGRMRNPRPDFLEDVARVLHMSARERTELFVYALGREPAAQPLLSDRDDPPTAQWESLIRNQPYPSLLTNSNWDVLACNILYADIFGEVAPEAALPPRGNFLRLTVLEPRIRPMLVGWERAWALPMLDELRLAIAKHPESQRLGELLAEVERNSAAKRLWHGSSEQSMDGGDRYRRDVVHPKLGLQKYVIMYLTPFGSDDTRVTLLVPANR